MREMSDDVLARLLPTIQQWLDRFPAMSIHDVTVTGWVNPDGTGGIDVHLMTEQGAQLIMRLDPPRYGLTFIGDELVTLEDPALTYAPLDPVAVEWAYMEAELERFLRQTPMPDA